MKSDKCTPTVKSVKLNACDKDMIPLIVLYSQARLCPTNLSRLATPLPSYMYMLSGAAVGEFDWLHYNDVMLMLPSVGMSAVATVAGSVSVSQQPSEDGPRMLKININK